MAPNLPGYYFDEEKKKYFGIQPNHIAPNNAKYSQANVQHEEHLAKKQKLEDNNKKVLKSQTVLSARVLKHSLLGGSGLLRECGKSSRTMVQREDAFLRGLQKSRGKNLHFPFGLVLDAHWTDSRVAVVSNAGIHSYERSDGPVYTDEGICHVTTPSLPYPQNVIINSTNMTTISGVPHILGCTNGIGMNAFLVPIEGSIGGGNRWTVDGLLFDCAVNDIDNTKLAFVGNSTVMTVDAFTHSVSASINLENFPSARTNEWPDAVDATSARKVEWLSEHTLAFATREHFERRHYNHQVMLWDVRSPTATSARWRRESRISGLSKPDTSGNNLIVTSNFDISMYDLRVLRADRPLLTIRHQSVGDVTYHATYNGNLLAAIDHNMKIQGYSWKTGRFVKTIHAPREEWWQQDTILMRSVKWVDEAGEGPRLQACHGKEVFSYQMSWL